MPQLSVIIPARNERESIRDLFSRIDIAMKQSGIDYEIVFMDSHSTDDSVIVAFQFAQTLPVHVFSQQNSLGKAGAIIEGVKHAQSDFVVMIDGDLQYPPECIPEMYALQDRFSVVVARRTDYKEHWIRKFFTYVHRLFFARMLFGLRCDVQSGLKLFPRSIINNIDLSYVTPWTFDLALLYTSQKLGYAIGEVPITFEGRREGVSKVNILGSIYEHSVSSIKFKLFPPQVKLQDSSTSTKVSVK